MSTENNVVRCLFRKLTAANKMEYWREWVIEVERHADEKLLVHPTIITTMTVNTTKIRINCVSKYIRHDVPEPTPLADDAKAAECLLFDQLSQQRTSAMSAIDNIVTQHLDDALKKVYNDGGETAHQRFTTLREHIDDDASFIINMNNTAISHLAQMEGETLIALADRMNALILDLHRHGFPDVSVMGQKAWFDKNNIKYFVNAISEETIRNDIGKECEDKKFTSFAPLLKMLQKRDQKNRESEAQRANAMRATTAEHPPAQALMTAHPVPIAQEAPPPWMLALATQLATVVTAQIQQQKQQTQTSIPRQNQGRNGRPSNSGGDPSSGSMYMGNLPEAITVEIIKGMFTGHGGATDITIGKSRNIDTKYAFFKIPAANVDRAIAALDKTVVLGRDIILNKAKNRSCACPTNATPSPVQHDLGTVDSGTTKHLTPHLQVLGNLRKSDDPSIFLVASGGTMQGSGLEGDIKSDILTIGPVEHVPSAIDTLLSVSQLLQEGKDVWFDSKDKSVSVGHLDDSGSTTLTQGALIDGQFRIPIRPLIHLTPSIIPFTDPSNPFDALRTPTPSTPETPLEMKRKWAPSRIRNASLLGAGLPSSKDFNLWHCRMHHASVKTILRTIPAVNGMKISGSIPKDFLCDACIRGKMHRSPYPHSHQRSGHKLYSVGVDIVFPEKTTPSLGGAIGFLGVSVHNTGYKIGYALKSKADAPRFIMFAKKHLERVTGEAVESFHLDKAGENRTKWLQQECESLGITLEYVPTEAHNANGEIEGWFRTAFDRVRSDLAASGAPKNLWADSLMSEVYVANRQVHAGFTKTSYELQTGHVPNVGDLRVNNCLAYVRILPKNTAKTQPRATRGRFIGYGNYDGQPITERGWKILTREGDPKSVVISRDVYFVENQFDIAHPQLQSGAISSVNWEQAHGPDDDDDEDVLPPSTRSDLNPPMTINDLEEDEEYATAPSSPVIPAVHIDIPNLPNIPDIPAAHVAPPPVIEAAPPPPPQPAANDPPPQPADEPRYPHRVTVPITRYGFENAQSAVRRSMSALMINDGGSFADVFSRAMLTRNGPSLKNAIKDPKWKLAMEKEITQMWEAEAFEWGKKPEGVNALGWVWALKLKVDDITGEEKEKARLAVDGSQQIAGVDYVQIYAAMPEWESIKAFMAIKTQRGMVSVQVDWKGAYLNAPIDRIIWMKVPFGMTVPSEHTGHHLFLKKAVYGTHQAANLWEQFRDNILIEYGFVRCPHDYSLFAKDINGHKLICAWHSDDGDVAGDRASDVEEFISWIQNVKRMTITVNRETDRMFLGVRVCHREGRTTMDQTAYIKDIVGKYLDQPLHPNGSPVTACTPWLTSTPDDFDIPSTQSDDDIAFFQTHDYRGAVGSLQHAQKTRSGDIGYAVGKVAAHAANPRKIHWTAVQRILAYLNGTADLGLIFKKRESLSLEAFSDADWASNVHTRRSISGIVLTLNGTAIISSSRSQKVVADSTVVAETIALTQAVKTVIWMRHLLEWFGYPFLDKTTVWCDNKGAVRNAEEGAERAKTRHMDIQYMFIRDVVKTGAIAVQFIRTEEQKADILMKGLGRVLHVKGCEALGMGICD